VKIETEGKILTAESKPYKIDGNEGVSHKIRINVEGEIYVCKSTAQQVNDLKQYEGKDGSIQFKVNSRKENMTLELVSFTPAM